jgi:glucosylceramidase
MKTNDQRSCFPFAFLDCGLLPEWRATWALYLSKYVTATQAALDGTAASLWGITVQNEPAPSTGTETYEGMCLLPWDEQELVRDYLGPLIRAQHPELKILGYDHNKDLLMAYAAFLLDDNATAPFVDGIAFHWCE